jgi:hypothetical protein
VNIYSVANYASEVVGVVVKNSVKVVEVVVEKAKDAPVVYAEMSSAIRTGYINGRVEKK